MAAMSAADRSTSARRRSASAAAVVAVAGPVVASVAATTEREYTRAGGNAPPRAVAARRPPGSRLAAGPGSEVLPGPLDGAVASVERCPQERRDARVLATDADLHAPLSLRAAAWTREASPSA